MLAAGDGRERWFRWALTGRGPLRSPGPFLAWSSHSHTFQFVNCTEQVTVTKAEWSKGAPPPALGPVPAYQRQPGPRCPAGCARLCPLTGVCSLCARPPDKSVRSRA